VGGVFRQENKPDVVVRAEGRDHRGEVGGEVIAYEDFNLLPGNSLDVGNEDL
jgi:hypothetical protein